VLAQASAARPAAIPFKGAPERSNGDDGEGGEAAPGEGDFDDDDMENSLSLAAIEAELKPKVVKTFDKIADAYKRLRRLQDQDIQNKLRNDSLSPAQERRYKKLKDEIISEVKSLRLNQARIDDRSAASQAKHAAITLISACGHRKDIATTQTNVRFRGRSGPSLSDDTASWGGRSCHPRTRSGNRRSAQQLSSLITPSRLVAN
jgi:Sigma-70, non-essential region